MGDVFIVDMGESDEERSRREAEREAERLRLRDRYVRHLMDAVGIDQLTADQVMAALLDHLDHEGRWCACDCHPRLSSTHGDGLYCRAWDEARRAHAKRSGSAFLDTPEAAALKARRDQEKEAIREWLCRTDGC